jgi:hypothetical protein
MKPYYMLICCLTLIVAIACNNGAQDNPAAWPAPYEAGGTAAGATLVLSLDSFQRRAYATLPARAAVRRIAASRLRIRRDTDSLTISGAVFAEGKNKANGAWHFYFRATAGRCYAYIKEDRSRVEDGLQKISRREAGYCLNFFKTAG